jgi:hypothetical protein
MTPQTIVTTEPPAPPPVLRCPSCDERLGYLCSYVAGTLRHPEQWDDYVCRACGRFQYRQRTRKLSRVFSGELHADQTQQRRRTICKD